MGIQIRPTRSPSAVVALNTSGAAAAILPASQVVADGTEVAIVDPGNTGSPMLLNIPPGGPFEQRPFEVVVSGYVSTGASSTATVKIYFGTSKTLSSDTLLGSTGALTAKSGKYPFSLRLRLIYDSVSGLLDGLQDSFGNGAILAPLALAGSPPLLSAISNSNNPVLSFVVSVTFGTGNAANKIVIQEFCATAVDN